jgi:hypothetical protein
MDNDAAAADGRPLHVVPELAEEEKKEPDAP